MERGRKPPFKQMNIIKIYKEIQKVGIKDWWWFVIWLKRDEFSLRLCSYVDKYSTLNRAMHYYAKDIKRAHEIEMKLADLLHNTK